MDRHRQRFPPGTKVRKEAASGVQASGTAAGGPQHPEERAPSLLNADPGLSLLQARPGAGGGRGAHAPPGGLPPEAAFGRAVGPTPPKLGRNRKHL